MKHIHAWSGNHGCRYMLWFVERETDKTLYLKSVDGKGRTYRLHKDKLNKPDYSNAVYTTDTAMLTICIDASQKYIDDNYNAATARIREVRKALNS